MKKRGVFWGGGGCPTSRGEWSDNLRTDVAVSILPPLSSMFCEIINLSILETSEHPFFVGGFSLVRFFRVVEVTSNDEVIGSEFRL